MMDRDLISEFDFLPTAETLLLTQDNLLLSIAATSYQPLKSAESQIGESSHPVVQVALPS